MVQRWIKAASTVVYLADFSRWDCPENHSDAGRGRRRGNVSVSTKEAICHAVHCFQSKQLQRHFHFDLILSLRQSDWKTQPHRLWLGWIFFSAASSFRQFSMRRAAKRKKRVSHLMVTKYIQLVLKSARQTSSHLQETSAFPRLKEGPSDCRGLEEQRKT